MRDTGNSSFSCGRDVMRMSRAQAYLMPGYKPDVVTQGTLNPKAPACIAEVPATPASSKARQWASRFGGALLLR